MIGYFTRAGDSRVGVAFQPWREGFNQLLKKTTGLKTYGKELGLILIEYYLEGEFLPLPAKKYKLLPYSNKERSISVVVAVSKDFAAMDEDSKKRFIVETTIESVRLVQSKMKRLGFTKIDFTQLLDDVEKCAKEYLG